MANPNKRIQKITNETVARWADTINSTAEPDVAGAEKLLKSVFPNKRVFTARTPLEFYIAQAVLRGRVTKRDGVKMAETLKLDPAFIKPLTRVGGPVPLLHRYRRWAASHAADMVAHTVQNYLHISSTSTNDRRQRMLQILMRNANLREIGRWPGPTVQFQLQDIRHLYWQFVADGNMRYEHDSKVSPEVKVLRDWRISFMNTQSHITNSVLSISEAVTEHPSDIVNKNLDSAIHRFDAVHAEIIARALNCHKDPDCTWLYEIFHLVPAIMQFNDGFLLLSGKPVLHKNSENELHNESGPAVEWADGYKAWFVNGHRLSNMFGEKIVMTPDKLVKQDIIAIQNEEERRVAIDRMGWNRYLAEIGAKIAHARENWVDNTYEVLINPPRQIDRTGFGREEPLRMVLSCRSTGRKYFLAVPREVPPEDITEKLIAAKERAGATVMPNLQRTRVETLVPIKSCEDAQKWFATGATTKYLDYAKHPMNVIGAS